MTSVRELEGVVQHYAWGDPTFLPNLLGRPPDGRPWAEWWIGTHPNGPARCVDGPLLSELAGELPYLLKVLAAARPLSLQTHPNEEQAGQGFAMGRYPDPHAKPELLHALTRFEALCGVRPADTTAQLLDELGLVELAAALATDGPRGTIEALLRRQLDVRGVVDACAASDRKEARVVTRLAELHPGDPAAAVALLLNHVVLEPGEAIRLDAGNLHAYLGGAGVELMGSSDNVVRGGLTDKPVDVDELLAVIDAEPLPNPTLGAAEPHGLAGVDVELTVVTTGALHTAVGHEIAVDLTGRAWYLAPGDVATFAAIAYVVTGGGTTTP